MLRSKVPDRWMQPLTDAGPASDPAVHKFIEVKIGLKLLNILLMNEVVRCLAMLFG